MAAIAPMLVEVGDPSPATGGLLNVAKSLGFLYDESDPHIGMGAAWQANVCGVNRLAPGVCDDALGLDPETEKTFDAFAKGEAQPFGVYKGFDCDLMWDDYQSVTRAAFEAGESYAVEQAVDALVLKGATDVGSATAHPVAEAIAMLEAEIATRGGNRGLIHVSRYGAAFLTGWRGITSDQNFHLWTKQGTPIVNGGGYTRTSPASAAVTDSQFWMYATGPMHLWRGPEVYSEGAAVETNSKQSLMERLYAAGVDCYRIAVLVDPTA